MTAPPRTLRSAEFAALAGVTVRALHHYDRIGLLKPRRGPSGYREYGERDLERLEQIVVLKFLGIPLRQIADLTSADSTRLASVLRAQRATIEKKRMLLDRAMTAIEDLERAVAAGGPAAPSMFTRIIEVIEMQNDPAAWTRQYEDLLAAKVERLRELSPDARVGLQAQWRGLLGDIRAALDEDVAGARAQALGTRWTDLLGQLMGASVDPAALQAHQGTQAWTPAMASFVDQPVWDFMTRVLAQRRAAGD